MRDTDVSTFLLRIDLDVYLDPLNAAYAYRNCSVTRTWAEKADYSECLNLISDIPSYEVSRNE